MPGFDARSILDALIVGSSDQTRSARESGGLGDIMGDILGQLKEGEGGAASRRFDQDEPSDRKEIYGDERNGNDPQRQPPSRPHNPLDDLFGELTGRGNERGRSVAPDGSYIARSGTQNEGGYGDILDQFKGLVRNNRTAAGAIIGGLGGLLLGTRTGRSLLGRAARLGGLALIGTLAYKAFKNHQQGSGRAASDETGRRFDVPDLPPSGSGFEEEALTNEDAALFIRTMVAAAAADGHIDRQEQQKILGHLEEAGLEDEAMEFLAREFNNPASIEDIVASVRNPEQAAKVYTAARIAIEPDTREEQQFLSYLSEQLELDSTMAAYIDAEASAIKVR